jgi:hypothetical protein
MQGCAQVCVVQLQLPRHTRVCVGGCWPAVCLACVSWCSVCPSDVAANVGRNEELLAAISRDAQVCENVAAF